MSKSTSKSTSKTAGRTRKTLTPEQRGAAVNRMVEAAEAGRHEEALTIRRELWKDASTANAYTRTAF